MKLHPNRTTVEACTYVRENAHNKTLTAVWSVIPFNRIISCTAIAHYLNGKRWSLCVRVWLCNSRSLVHTVRNTHILSLYACIRTVFDRCCVCFLFRFSFTVSSPCTCTPLAFATQRFYIKLNTVCFGGNRSISCWDLELKSNATNQPFHLIYMKWIIVLHFQLFCLCKTRIILLRNFMAQKTNRVRYNNIWKGQTLAGFFQINETTNNQTKTVRSFSVVMFFFYHFYCFFPLRFSMALFRCLFLFFCDFITSSYVFSWGITSYCIIMVFFFCFLRSFARSSFHVFVSFHLLSIALQFNMVCLAFMRERPEHYCYFFRGDAIFDWENDCLCMFYHFHRLFAAATTWFFFVRFLFFSFDLFCLPAITLVFWFNVINFKQRLNAESERVKTTAAKLLHSRIREQFNNH